jgi:hypothetical protein
VREEQIKGTRFTPLYPFLSLGGWLTLPRVAYLQSFRSTKLGIDPDKEGEVYECGPDGTLRQYGGWFYFAGEVIEMGERLTDAGSSFQYYFVDVKHLPAPDVNFGPTVAAIEFYAKVPWIISEQP